MNEPTRASDAPADGEPVAVRPRDARRPFKILGAIFGAVVVCAGVYLLLTAGEEETDDAQVTADVVPVSAKVGGTVKAVPIKENDPVKQGQLLIELDDEDYRARERQAEAELETARAQAQAAEAQVAVTEASSRGGLEAAKAVVSGSALSVSGAEAQVASARAGLQRAQADLAKAETDLGRWRRLVTSGAGPQERLDNAQSTATMAQAAVAQAQANLRVAEDAREVARSRVSEARGHLGQSTPIESQIAVVQSQAALARARVKSAEATLDLARIAHRNTKILAPIDGVASKLGAQPGQLLQAGQTIIALVPAATYVVANFKETQIGKMRAGQRAEIRVDAFPGRRLVGQVESLSGGTGSSFSLLPPDNASGNFVKVVQRVPVRLRFTEGVTDLALRAGLSATAMVHVK